MIHRSSKSRTGRSTSSNAYSAGVVGIFYIHFSIKAQVWQFKLMEMLDRLQGVFAEKLEGVYN